MEARTRSIADAVLDVFYVPKCALCGFVDRPTICSVCEGEMEPLDSEVRPGSLLSPMDGMARLYRYSSRAEQAVTRLKYSRVTALAMPMAERIAAFASELRLLDADLILPVPIHRTRQRLRGFNQSELLCEALPKEALRLDLLSRIRATAPQAGLTQQERIANVRGAFRASPDVRGQSVLLVDDVLTSGTTMGECAKALKDAGAREVIALAFAGAHG